MYQINKVNASVKLTLSINVYLTNLLDNRISHTKRNDLVIAITATVKDLLLLFLLRIHNVITGKYKPIRKNKSIKDA